MLSFNDITLMIGEKPLLDQCTGQVNSGDVIALVGQSGSGKSLLLKVLAGLIKPTHGAMTWQGQTLSQLGPSTWRAHLGYIQQSPELIEGTVLDNLRLPFTFKFYQHQSFDIDWHRRYLVQLGKPSQFLEQPAQHLSGGERQIVNLLRRLQLPPNLLLLDEPTAALDPQSRHDVERLILTWQAEEPHRSIIWVSHDTAQIARLIDAGGVQWQMQAGRLRCL